MLWRRIVTKKRGCSAARWRYQFWAHQKYHLRSQERNWTKVVCKLQHFDLCNQWSVRYRFFGLEPRGQRKCFFSFLWPNRRSEKFILFSVTKPQVRESLLWPHCGQLLSFWQDWGQLLFMSHVIAHIWFSSLPLSGGWRFRIPGYHLLSHR